MYKLSTMYVQNKNILKQEKLHLNKHFNKLKKQHMFYFTIAFALLLHLLKNLFILFSIFLMKILLTFR